MLFPVVCHFKKKNWVHVIFFFFPATFFRVSSISWTLRLITFCCIDIWFCPFSILYVSSTQIVFFWNNLLKILSELLLWFFFDSCFFRWIISNMHGDFTYAGIYLFITYVNSLGFNSNYILEILFWNLLRLYPWNSQSY